MPDLLPYQDPNLPVERRVNDLIERMSLEEKVGQMVQADGRKNAEEQVRAGAVGSFLHILGDVTVELQKLAEQTRHGIPLIFGIDAIHGHGFWPGATVFPTQLALSCSWNPEHLRVMGRITAKEMLATGLHWTFSPVLCLTRDLRWGRVGETFGEDPFLIGEFGKAAVKGYQGDDLRDDDSVLACAKHYAGYSETVGGRDATEADLSRRKLLTYFLPPFEAVARSGCKSFMTAYQCIDGLSCAMNPWLLTELLRDEWGFDGFVVTDWDNVGRAHTQQALYPSIESAVPDAVRAGNDMIMVTPLFYEGAIANVRKGELSEQTIDQACRRVLTVKFELGLFDGKRYPKQLRTPEIIGCDAHREALLPAALESIVLLKNAHGSDGNAQLPLGSPKRIAVLGPNADNTLAQLGDWSFGSGQAGLTTDGHPRGKVRTVLDGVKARAARDGIAVEYARGCDVLSDDESGIAAAASLAASCDVAVVVVGDHLDQIGEECDRSELDLTGGQMSLLRAVHATNTPIVAVLINSKPLCIPWLEQNAAAIVEAFNPGMLGGDAVARVLFGDFNPQGKLTVSFPSAIGEQPVYYQQIPGWHGSKHKNYRTEPLFAFGFGLSYTRFSYSNLTVTNTIRRNQPVEVRVTVANVGDRDGTEIVQVYLNDVFTTLSTPNKTLVAFERVPLRVGEAREVRLELPFDSLAFIDQAGKRVVEPGEFEVLVGSSSRDQDLDRVRFTYQD